MKFEDGNIEVTTKQSKIVISKENTYNFKEVIRDIGRGKHLYISTFNYYMDSNINEEVIKEIDYINDIRVIVNMYNSSKLSDIVKNGIKTNPFIQMYYCKNNHSKIISTGSKMYIGSANYTGYSKENFEVGVVIDEKEAIEEIEKKVFYGVFEYFPIIHDPIQPLVILFTQIINFEKNNLNLIEGVYDYREKGFGISENDFENTEYDLLTGFEDVYYKIMNKMKVYISENRNYFYEEGILLENYIDRIDKKLKEIIEEPLGSYTDSFYGFYEDYIHCNPEFKEMMLREEIVEGGIEGKDYERFIFSKYKSLLNMLLYLRVRWIKEYNDFNNKYIICDKQCAKYLFDLEGLVDLSSQILEK